MPFINDRLESDKDKSDKLDYELDAKRTSRFTFSPTQVMKNLRENIVGQDHILDSMEEVLFTVKADFGQPNRPLSVLLFLGSTGVGKTETVRIISQSILGSADKLCRIDMNTLAQEHYSAAITGSPPGYVGSKEGQTLFDQEKINGSFSQPGIVLFDEIEKADHSVVNALLNIFDTGKLRLSSGNKELDFSNCMVFMTSNLGAKVLSEHIQNSNKALVKLSKILFNTAANSDDNKKDQLLDSALHQHFQPEFLNRIDRTVIFNSLNESNLHALIDIEIKKLNKRLKKRDAEISISSELSKHFEKKYDPRFGARDISRNLLQQLEPKIAKAIISQPKIKSFRATLENKELSVEPL